MSELFLVRALLFAAECFAVSLVLPLLGFAVTALLRRAALRHLVWATLFGVLAVLPFVALLLPARQVMQQAPAPMMEAPPVMAIPDVVAPVLAPAPPLPASSWVDLLTVENAILLLIVLWLAGLAWQVLRLGLGAIGLMRLRRASMPFASEIETGCAVRLADGEQGPSTFGIFSPMVLLPRAAAGWPAARLEAVLRHEAAHVARRDVAAQAIARLVCALYWINPLLWLGYRALRREAEIAADDAVLAGGMMPSLYATELVRLAADARGVTPGVAMAGPPLTKRIEAVLSDNVSRKGVSRMDMAKVGLLGLTATLLLGAARFDLAVAQDGPAPKVERNVEKDVAIDAKAKADVEAMARAGAAMREGAQARQQTGAAMRDAAEARQRAQSDVQRALEAQAAAKKAYFDTNVAQARARAAAETDPKTKEIFRREAEEMAAKAAVDKADVDLGLAQARQAARERAEADMRPARAIVDAQQARAIAISETALARTQEALARQAQTQPGDKADPGKQQLMQLMADSVAVARQEMAKARLRADEDAARAREMADTARNGAMPPDSHASASSSQSAESSTNGVSTVRRSHQGDGKDDNVDIDVQINGGASGKIMANAKARQTLDETIRTAVAEARNRINAAIARANAEVGATADKAGEDSNVDLNWRYVPDRMAPAPRALPAPPPPAPLPPPPAPLPPAPALPN